ncbi:HNH endonuclease signature motif containing protein [Nocardioides lacusdianchii]|uniref:HNH endonuclease signature motif containing protein n=1 Tax=Nocardioides lacusdianchii TaxID=2783664 RepID=UPI001CC9E4DA|nr:HNH endonuclease signature motif containing protein [Nocardioides lacusdianchii]
MHPIIECADDLGAALKGVASVEPAFMSVGEKQSALVGLVEVRSQLDALLARVLGASDDVAAAHGLRDAAAWLAVETRTTRREARRDLALGRALAQHPWVATALTSGAVRTEQARMVVEAVDALPSHVGASVRDDAEEALLRLALQHDARELKQIGKRILDVVAPEVGESHEEAVLRAEEDRATVGVELTMVDDGEGRCRGSFVVPSHVGAMLKRHLLALANPARHAEDELRDESGEWKPLRRRLGEALIEYVERYPVDATPQTAGVNATVVVTMTIEQLLGETATALLDEGSRMSAGQARRLACEAGIIPVVLDSKSVPLDMGRAARLFTKSQRIALGLRDGGCTARGCETSASGCHAHHDDPWSRSGLTDLANGRLLCPRHHRLAHDSRYAMTVHADNKVTYARRT